MSFIAGILTFFLVINCLLLILLVLVQLPKKDAGAGLAFGGGAADALFGAGSGNVADQGHEMGDRGISLCWPCCSAICRTVCTRATARRHSNKQVEQKQMQTPISSPPPVTPPAAQPRGRVDQQFAGRAPVGAHQCPGGAGAIEITRWPFPNAPGGFFRGRVLLFASRSALLLSSGCARHEPPADLTIINGVRAGIARSRPSSSGQADMRIVLGLFEGLTRLGPENAPRRFPGWRSAGIFHRTVAFTPFICAPIWSGPPANRSRRTTWFIRGFARSIRRRPPIRRTALLPEKRGGFQHRQNQGPVARGRPRAGPVDRARRVESSHAVLSRHLRHAGDLRRAAPDD